MDEQALRTELERDEGVRNKPYSDQFGNITIGIGRNLTGRGLSQEEIDLLYATDVGNAEDDLDRNIGWWRDLPDDRQRVLVNMCFNMGWPALSGFHDFLGALQRQDYNAAAQAMLDSAWAGQVGQRAIRLANMVIGKEHNV